MASITTFKVTLTDWRALGYSLIEEVHSPSDATGATKYANYVLTLCVKKR